MRTPRASGGQREPLHTCPLYRVIHYAQASSRTPASRGRHWSALPREPGRALSVNPLDSITNPFSDQAILALVAALGLSSTAGLRAVATLFAIGVVSDVNVNGH